MTDKKEYHLRGVKEVDGEFYIPIFEIVNLCRYFPNLSMEQLRKLLENSVDELKKNEVLLKEVPKLTAERKKSFVEKWFKK